MPNININDFLSERIPSKNTGNILSSATDSEKIKTHEKNIENLPLRNIEMDQPFYMQGDLKGDAAKEMEARIASGQPELLRKNAMVLAAGGMTEQDFSKMKEDGFTPSELDEEGMVTIADKIRIQLAKGGADISMMGDVSDAALSEVAGGEAVARSIESAVEKAGEITKITDDTKKYLIKNELEPTIENVYKANFSISEKYEYQSVSASSNQAGEDELKALLPQVEGVIKKAGLPVNDTTLDGAKWLLSQKMALTPESIKDYLALSGNELKTGEEEIKGAILEAVNEGKRPEEAYIINGYSVSEVAKSTKEMLDSITDTKLENAVKKDTPLTISAISSESEEANTSVEIKENTKEAYDLVSARRSLEEIRLTMTFEASVTLIRRGISIDTRSLSELVEDLKAEENRLYSALFSGGNDKVSFEDKIKIYEEANSHLNIVKGLPAEALGGFSSVTKITVRSLEAQGSALLTKYKAAGESYETLMTSPRKDLGDSIKKAFRNVDDILEDLGFEATESNERAVRILGYNSLSITKESVITMRQADESLQQVFKNLTPGVVAKMVKEGENPLDMSLPELNEKIKEIKENDPGTSSDEQFAEFLFKMDRKKELSDDERNGFIGVYRLMHQVVESDGAVIGALIHQGAEITMRNMMTAIRSDKHKNREAVIDDNFGMLSEFKKDSLSITEQIEMAFQTDRMMDAKNAVTPSKLEQFESEDIYMNMTPDALAAALENMDEPEGEDAAYIADLKRQVEEAVQTETKVYAALKQFDMPVTPANLAAMNAFLSDRNNVYRNVFSNTVTEEDLEKTPEELMADILRRFGEAVKTPEDMADAQQKLAEQATNVMKEMLVEQEVSHVDIRGMRVALTQVRMLGEIATKSENYTIPIMVADEQGTLNLKVVRGNSENNGLVDIAFNMDKTGPVNATFKASAQGITGSIECVKDGIIELLEGMENELSSAMEEVSNLSVSLEFDRNNSLNGENIYDEKDVDFETGNERFPIQTQTLYGIARCFINILGKIN